MFLIALCACQFCVCWSVGFVACMFVFDGTVIFILEIVVHEIFVVYDSDGANNADSCKTANRDGVSVATVVLFILFELQGFDSPGAVVLVGCVADSIPLIIDLFVDAVDVVVVACVVVRCF